MVEENDLLLCTVLSVVFLTVLLFVLYSWETSFYKLYVAGILLAATCVPCYMLLIGSLRNAIHNRIQKLMRMK
jgi:hypothetical protein